jgi:2-keto-4-pentenoate hydratase/2-oxohepta-3-ene-1,7-dioic acid hydratase in catechol pathway
VPASSHQLDWEAELVAVIGRQCAGVEPAAALHYVAGYTIANDLSARHMMRRADQPDSAPFLYDWLGHKSFDGSCPLGPWIVPACAIPDPQRLSIKLWVDDRLRQDGHTSDMIFSVAEQISYLSQRMTLYPGDIVLTGTPSGVGAESNEYLAPGNRVRIEIDAVGELHVTVVGPGIPRKIPESPPREAQQS